MERRGHYRADGEQNVTVQHVAVNDAPQAAAGALTRLGLSATAASEAAVETRILAGAGAW